MSRKWLVAVLGAILCAKASAQLDTASQNVLIDKLEKVYLHLAPGDTSKVSVTLRLADLYAERARRSAMGGDCAGCPDSAADRTKALRLYNEVLERAPEATRPKIMIQIGHLQQMSGREDKAIEFYRKILGSEKDPQLVGEANLSLAEIYFKRRDFRAAIPHYEQVLSLPQSGSRGLAAYRRAWCRFHLGDLNAALSELEHVLKTPEMLSRSSTNRAQVDTQFHEEVSRDYAVFLAKSSITKARVDGLFALSPESTRIANVQALASETERLGKRDEALIVWEFIAQHLSQPQERIAAQLSMSQLHLDKGDKASALKNYELAMQTWRDVGFNESTEQTELKRRARHFVVAWNQVEKKAPSAELLSAYDLYLTLFPQDTDARLYAAQIAVDQKKWPAAWNHYSAARSQLSADPAARDRLETVLLSQLELAEASGDEALTQQAYDSYIQYSPKKTKLAEVRYQKARAVYDKGDYSTASSQLKTLALDASVPAALRKTSADLALDSLVLMKDERQLVSWAREFETAFPNHRADFSQVAQKAILTRSAQLAEKDPAGALKALNEFEPAKASEEDKAKYYKNKLLLSEKEGQVREAAAAADSLLALKNISKEDREFAWARKAYFAELRLDFSTAFAATEKLESTLPAEEKAFKLAVFAELSGKPSAPLYINYLGKTKDEERRRLVAAELVRKSKAPEAEIEKVKSALVGSPELLARLYAEAYAKNPSDVTLKKVTGDKKLAATEAGRLLVRQQFLKDFAKMRAQLSGDKLDTGNKLGASIKRRAALLNKAEELAKASIQSGDWTAQLVSIDLLSRESERFYQDLLSAPMPQGLTPEEESEYLNLLSAQAAPYQAKAAEGKAKVNEFWGNDWSTALSASYPQKAIRPLIQSEINALKEIAPEAQAGKFAAFTDAQVNPQRPSLQEVQAARQKVFENPLDKAALETLLNLERKNENGPMSEYLSSRLDRLTKGTL